MRNWIVQQGWGMYLMLGMTAAGILGNILCRIFYGRLAKEAQVCGTSDYPMLHYIRQKYTSYYKLGMQPSDTRAIVRRYLALHKVGFMSLSAWRSAGTFMMAGVIMAGLVGGLYRFQAAYESGPAIILIGTSLVLTVGLWMVGRLLSVDNLQDMIENALCDYLGNYLKSKLDGEYGYGRSVEKPENYESILKETAASRVSSGNAGNIRSAAAMGRRDYSRPVGNRVQHDLSEFSNTDAVDAKIVEDVLKEFLC